MSDASAPGFGKFVPGFDFLQNLATQAAGGLAQGIGQNLPQMPNLSHWVAPTFNVEELEKRIEELKAVHFWLDQNAKALGATIQALEVQKMTLSTLKSMNFSMGDVANALKLKAADTVAGFTAAAAPASKFAGLEVAPRHNSATDAPAKPARKARKPAAKKAAAAAAPAPPAGVVDPVQWWGALSQQFQQIASNALKDVAKQTALDTTRQVASGLGGAAVKTATGLAGQAARKAARALSPTPAKKAPPARKARASR
ncbi:PhaM family polyhydroxyalkanoate granule multifunctional regulatory protein [Hydrogenophaga sp. T2]|uniref:PhaM family polyhydroxyalkanoate granule multifunctional regulatory protein n=1 Tax=Hydrogenophaga sp. T2 TaxID=3132823 RepID=UPI003CEDE96A